MQNCHTFYSWENVTMSVNQRFISAESLLTTMFLRTVFRHDMRNSMASHYGCIGYTMSYVTSASQVQHFRPLPPFHKCQLSPNSFDLSLNSTSLDRNIFQTYLISTPMCLHVRKKQHKNKFYSSVTGKYFNFHQF